MNVETLENRAAAPASPDDETLLRQYVDRNDCKALETLLRRHANLAYATAMNICRHPADAEDAVQTAFIKVMKTAAQYRGGTARGVEVWITMIVVGSCKNRIRSEVRRRRWEQLASDEQQVLAIPGSDTDTDPESQMAEVALQALNELPERYRLPIVLHHYQGLSLKETADTMAIPEGTLHTHLRRGMSALKDHLNTAGVRVSTESLAAIIPLMRLDIAPPSLLDRIPAIVRGRIKAVVPGRPTAATWFFPTAAAILAVSGAVVALKMQPEQKAVVPPPVTSPAPTPKLNYRWNFDSPEMPKEFKVIAGTLKHQPKAGIDGSGCLEARNAVVRIDIAITSFPVRVSFLSSTANPMAKLTYSAGTQWLPVRSMGLFCGLNDLPRIDLSDSTPVSPWTPHVMYYSGRSISRWSRSSLCDIFMVPMEPDGRITLQAEPDVLIDNLVIESISSNELPDIRRYVDAFDQIPPEKRKGDVALPQFKRGSNLRNPPTVFVRFFTNCNEFADGTVVN